MTNNTHDNYFILQFYEDLPSISESVSIYSQLMYNYKKATTTTTVPYHFVH